MEEQNCEAQLVAQVPSKLNSAILIRIVETTERLGMEIRMVRYKCVTRYEAINIDIPYLIKSIVNKMKVRALPCTHTVVV